MSSPSPADQNGEADAALRERYDLAICDIHMRLLNLLHITPGGSSIHLPAMADEADDPDPDRDLLVVRMALCWVHYMSSDIKSQEYTEARAASVKEQARLEKEAKNIVAGMQWLRVRPGKKTRPVEHFELLARGMSMRRDEEMYLAEASRLLKQANKEAVDALKQEMKDGTVGLVASDSVNRALLLTYIQQVFPL